MRTIKKRSWLLIPTRLGIQSRFNLLSPLTSDNVGASTLRVRQQGFETMEITFAIVGLIFGLFAFSQIIYPLFSAWPRAKRLERDGMLIKPIPIATFIVAPIIWGALLTGTIWLVNNYFAEYAKVYYIALAFILIVVIAQIPKQNRDLEADFKDSWKRYLKNSKTTSKGT